MDILSKKSMASTNPRAAAAPPSGGAGLKLSVLPSFKMSASGSDIGEAKWPLVVVILLAVLVLGAWVALNYYENYMEDQVGAMDLKIAELQNNENKDSAQKIKQLQQSLKVVGPLLKEHVLSSPTLQLLQESTLPQVRYANFDLKTDEAVMSVSGEAQSYNVLAKQIAILNGNKMITNVEVGKVALGQTGGVSFQLTIALNPSLFKK